MPAAAVPKVVDRARADLAAGRAWKARDRLRGALDGRADPRVLDLLGEVLFTMGDLPAAGAAWAGTDRSGPERDAAEAAWRERHRGDAHQLWLSLPACVRQRRSTDAVRRLHDEAVAAVEARRRSGSPAVGGTADLDVPPARPRAGLGEIVAVLVVIGFLGCAVVGAVTVIRWLVP